MAVNTGANEWIWKNMMINKDDSCNNNSNFVLSQATAKHQGLLWQQQMGIKLPFRPDILTLPWWVARIGVSV